MCPGQVGKVEDHRLWLGGQAVQAALPGPGGEVIEVVQVCPFGGRGSVGVGVAEGLLAERAKLGFQVDGMAVRGAVGDDLSSDNTTLSEVRRAHPPVQLPSDESGVSLCAFSPEYPCHVAIQGSRRTSAPTLGP